MAGRREIYLFCRSRLPENRRDTIETGPQCSAIVLCAAFIGESFRNEIVSMTAPITLVLFDMEGVLSYYDRAGRLARLAAISGRTPDAVRDAQHRRNIGASRC